MEAIIESRDITHLDIVHLSMNGVAQVFGRGGHALQVGRLDFDLVRVTFRIHASSKICPALDEQRYHDTVLVLVAHVHHDSMLAIQFLVVRLLAGMQHLVGSNLQREFFQGWWLG